MRLPWKYYVLRACAVASIAPADGKRRETVDGAGGGAREATILLLGRTEWRGIDRRRMRRKTMWLDGKRQQPRLAAPYKSWLRRRGAQVALVGPLAAVYGLPTWIKYTAWADHFLWAGRLRASTALPSLYLTCSRIWQR
jgi:hypothetical protein